MIERYEDSQIEQTFSLLRKGEKWQKVELAVVEAYAEKGKIQGADFQNIESILNAHPIDVKEWLRLEEEIGHDLNAAVAERRRFLPPSLQPIYHADVTSYDIEDTTFNLILAEAVEIVSPYFSQLEAQLIEMAKKFRYCPMPGVSHGQKGDPITFGQRCQAWLTTLRIDREFFELSQKYLRYGKMSGAMSNYVTINPEVADKALGILRLVPMYGTGQILPREIYIPLASAMIQTIGTIAKIALDIWCGARSDSQINQPPFPRKGMGSSIMVYKRNPWRLERQWGIYRAARANLDAIIECPFTAEERTMEQSSVERICWPDLFHLFVHSFREMLNALQKLEVNPDKMLEGLRTSKGCYAGSMAKSILVRLCAGYELTGEELYRIPQLAAFMTLQPAEAARALREQPPTNLKAAHHAFAQHCELAPEVYDSIQFIIAEARLATVPELGITQSQVHKWNGILKEVFKEHDNRAQWDQIFNLEYLLRNEEFLFTKVIGP